MGSLIQGLDTISNLTLYVNYLIGCIICTIKVTLLMFS